MKEDFSITYKDIKVSWSSDAAVYLKRKKELNILEKASVFLESLYEEEEEKK